MKHTFNNNRHELPFYSRSVNDDSRGILQSSHSMDQGSVFRLPNERPDSQSEPVLLYKL